MELTTGAIRLIVVASITMAIACVGAVVSVDLAVAQSASPAPASGAAKKPKAARQKTATDAKKDPAEAQKALDAGIRAYQAGKLDLALQQLDKAMSNGGLAATQVSRALYYRGLAHRKQGKPALAISDLTNALWLKGGLSEAERADALAQRSQSYREAGLTEPTTSAEAAASATPKSAGARTATAEAVSSSTTDSAPSGIASFFSNLLGGSSSSSPPPASFTSDGSTGALPSPSREPPTRSVGTGWSSATEVSPPPERPARKVATKTAPPARTMTTGALTASGAPGGIRINVASVKSREEAQAVAERIRREHPADLANRQLTVEEGAGATFNVRIGQFAHAEESRELCAQLRKTGLTCVILAR